MQGQCVLYVRGIIVEEISLVPGVLWIGEVIWGSGKEALVFFHRAGSVYRRFLSAVFFWALSVFAFALPVRSGPGCAFSVGGRRV